MFKVTIGEDEYKVDFLHNAPTEKSIEDWFRNQYVDEINYRMIFGTVCRIITNHGALISNEMACLSIHDQFNRSIGRKVSLTKALQSAFPGEQNKSIRKLFWEAYYKARNGKW